MTNLMSYPDAYGHVFTPTPTPAAMNYMNSQYQHGSSVANHYGTSAEQSFYSPKTGHYDPTSWTPSTSNSYTDQHQKPEPGTRDYYYYDTDEDEDVTSEYYYNTERPNDLGSAGYYSPNSQQHQYYEPNNNLDQRIRNIRRNDAIFR